MVSSGRQRVAVRQDGVQELLDAVAQDGEDDDGERQHEQGERQVGGPDEIGDPRRPPDQLPRREHQRPRSTAGQMGETPSSDAAPNPATTRPTTTTATTGSGGTVVTGSPTGLASSLRNSRRRTTNSTATATSPRARASAR